MTDKDFPSICHQYARDVVDGKIRTGKYIKLQCQRHLDWVGDADCAWYFDEDESTSICTFAEMMPLTRGAFGTMRLEPWQIFLLSCIFGWKNKENGLRKHKEAVLIIARKNGKSILASIIGLYCLTANENAPEVVCGATTQKQAFEIFKAARVMCERSPDFMKHFLIEPRASDIQCRMNGGVFEPLVFQGAKEGGSPSTALIDEYWAHPDDRLYRAQRTGMGARDNPLLVIVSTTGDSVNSPLYAKEQHCKRVLRGEDKDDRLFSMIFQADNVENWTDWKEWVAANPNLNVSVREEYLREVYEETLRDITVRNYNLSRALCVWPGGANAAFDMLKWDKCVGRPDGTPFKLEDFKGEPAIVSYDLSARYDLSAQIVLFQDTTAGEVTYYFFHKSFVPEARLLEKKWAFYRKWVEDGWMVESPGELIDLELVEQDFLKLAEDHDISHVVFDPVNLAVGLQQRLLKEGYNVVQFSPTALHCTAPFHEIQGAILSQTLRHQADPCLTWQMNNVRIKHMNELKKPIKDSPDEKIDACDALVAAIATALEERANAGQRYAGEGYDEIMFI